MNWPKMKTTLIFMFLVIDLFLLVWNVSLRKESLAVDKDTIENTIKLLSDRGIEISDGIIDLETPEIGYITVRNSMANEAEFLSGVLGQGYLKEGNRFYTENREILISENSFEIKEKREIESLDEAEKWLASMGFDLKDTVRTKYKNGYIFRTMHKGFEVFKSRITIQNNDGVATAEGSLFYIAEEDKGKSENIHVSSVLPRLIKENISGNKITSITTGYLPVFEDGAFSESKAGAVYRILLSDGREFYYSAEK